jgi:transcriptional/translational regulatory protein YebC/TACO1
MIPLPGDLSELLKKDFESIEETMDKSAIINSTETSYKKVIKTKVRKAAFKYLTELKAKHSKIKQIEYEDLETQRYLTSPLSSNEDVSFLFSLRSRFIDCKANFKNQYKDTNILCPVCKDKDDTQ